VRFFPRRKSTETPPGGARPIKTSTSTRVSVQFFRSPPRKTTIITTTLHGYRRPLYTTVVVTTCVSSWRVKRGRRWGVKAYVPLYENGVLQNSPRGSVYTRAHDIIIMYAREKRTEHRRDYKRAMRGGGGGERNNNNNNNYVKKKFKRERKRDTARARATETTFIIIRVWTRCS